MPVPVTGFVVSLLMQLFHRSVTCLMCVHDWQVSDHVSTCRWPTPQNGKNQERSETSIIIILSSLCPLSYVTHNSCYQQPWQQSFTRHCIDVITTYLSSGTHDIDSLSLRISPLYQDRWEGSRGTGEIQKRLSDIMQQPHPLLPYHWAELAVHWFSHFWGLRSHQRWQVTIMIGFRGFAVKILLFPLLTPSSPSFSFLIYGNQYHRPKKKI